MTRQEEKEKTKKRILASCVKLFTQQGYYKTTLSQIVKESKVSFSSFQNIFGTKDGVLLELTKLMFDSQFETAKKLGGNTSSPVLVYAVETSIQLTITILNENLREIYVEAYSNPESSEYIFERTAKEISKIFLPYNPDCKLSDFYELEIGSSGIMRNYMVRKCDHYFTWDKKIKKFLTMTLRSYNVPKEEIEKTIEFVFSMDIREISNQIIHKLFENLAMQLHFELDKIEKNQ